MRRTTLLASALVTALITPVSCAGGNDGASGGVRGVVRAGPQCPVVVAGSPCPDLPWQGMVRISSTGGDVVVEASTTAEGRFEFALEPGEYVASAVVEPTGVGGASPTTVTVGAGAWTEVTLSVDTGIR